MLDRATDFCEYRGFPVRSDPDYGGAVNWGVYRAMLAPPHPKYTRTQVACLYAMRECIRTLRDVKRWHAVMALGPRSESTRCRVQLSREILDIADEALLEFAAAVGRWRAAKLLQLPWPTFRRLLDEAALRLRNKMGGEDWVDL